MNWPAGYDTSMRFYPGKLARDVVLDGSTIPARSRPDERTSELIDAQEPADVWAESPRTMPVMSLRAAP